MSVISVLWVVLLAIKIAGLGAMATVSWWVVILWPFVLGVGIALFAAVAYVILTLFKA